MLDERHITGWLLGAALLGVAGVTSGWAADVSGVVRDTHGTPQMGVLVEMLGAGGFATALTDLHGRFEMKDVQPGQYDLRTSGAFFSPVLRRGLRVSAGRMPALTVVLTGWFDEVGSLAPHARAVGDAATDWKWTLRSPAARPMLRLAEEDPATEETRRPERGAQHGTMRASAGTAGFGQSPESVGLLVGASSRGGRTEDRLEVLAGAAGWNSTGVPTGARASYLSGRGEGLQREVSVTARALPQVISGDAGEGLVLLRVDSLQRMEVGSFAAVEVGGRSEAVRTGEMAVAVRPVLRFSVHPEPGWELRYDLESTPGQGADAATARPDLPTVMRTAHGSQLVLQQEQALRVVRRAGRVRAEVAVLHEREGAGVLNGAFVGGGNGAFGATMVDTVTGTFRQVVAPYGGWGGTMALETAVGGATDVAARLMMAPGEMLRTGAAAAFAVRAVERPAVLFEVKRSVARTGTVAGVSYRWQPTGMLTTVGAFEASQVAPYLGVHVRQKLPVRCGEGHSAELLVDGGNVLGEGYHHVPTGTASDAQEAVLMSALREIRAGVEVSF